MVSNECNWNDQLPYGPTAILMNSVNTQRYSQWIRQRTWLIIKNKKKKKKLNKYK